MAKIYNLKIDFSMSGNNQVLLHDTADIPLTTDTTVGKLKEKITDKEGFETADLRLVFQGKQLEDGKKLSYYDIKSKSCITGVVRLLGGTRKFVNDKVEECKMAKLTDKPCSTCFDDSADEKRAYFHGDESHRYCAECMFNSARKDIFNGIAYIGCPKKECNVQIDMISAFTVCGIKEDDAEWSEWENQLNRNALNFKICPNDKCKSFVAKDRKEMRVKCPRCKAYDWCWLCLGRWKSNGQMQCGNDSCSIIADMIAQLQNSWDNNKKQISGINGVPNIRACTNPACARLNEHKDNCKHYTCKKIKMGDIITGCGHQYCQVCLKVWENCKCAYCQAFGQNEKKCNLSTTCTVAPLQYS